MRSVCNCIPWPSPMFIGLLAGPQAESIMMLGCRYDIFRTRTLKYFGPFIGVEKFRFEHGCKIEIWEILSVRFIVKFRGGGIVIPLFGIGIMFPVPLGISPGAIG